jgi:hypothetical protein
MLRPLFSKIAGRLLALTSESCDGLAGQQSEGAWGIADVLYEAVESFVAKCEAEAHLEEKVIKFPTVAQRS